MLDSLPRQDFTVYIGEPFAKAFRFQNESGETRNLTGSTAFMQIRSLSGVLIHDLSQSTMSIVIDTVINKVFLYLTAEQIKAKGTGVFEHDFKLINSSGEAKYKFGGAFYVVNTVTNVP